MTAVVERPYITIDRRDLLLLVRAGRIYRSMGGCSMQMVRAGQNRRVDRRLRELVDVGWVELGPDDRFYRLTADGERDLTARLEGGAR